MIARDINGDELAVGDIVVCGDGGHYMLLKKRIKSITRDNVSLEDVHGRYSRRCIRPHSCVVLVKEKA